MHQTGLKNANPSPNSRHKNQIKKRRQVRDLNRRFFGSKNQLFVVFGFQYFTTTVEAVRADVVTQVSFTGCWFDCQLWCSQKIVRTVHTTFGWGFFILLNCHDNS